MFSANKLLLTAERSAPPDFDSMDADALREMAKSLYSDNCDLLEDQMLKGVEMHMLKKNHEKLKSEYSKLLDKQSSDRLIAEQNDKLTQQNKELKELVKELQSENMQLKTKIEEFESSIQKQNLIISGQSARITALEELGKPITVREAMRSLERFICLKACGSKTKFWKFYNFDKITNSGDPVLQAAFLAELNRLNMGPNHVAMLGYLKDEGDVIIHLKRPNMSRQEWDDLFDLERTGSETDEELAEVDLSITVKKELFVALEAFIPVATPDAPWTIVDPMPTAKPAKKPALVHPSPATSVVTTPSTTVV